jgi:hypothetical protein
MFWGARADENFQDIGTFSDELWVIIYHVGCPKHIHNGFIGRLGVEATFLLAP